jgi:tetratricopeptide (TPR) repeat protein
VLRRSRLRLVATGCCVAFLAACGLDGEPQNSDTTTDTVSYSAVLDGRGLLASGQTAEAAVHFERLLAQHPGSLQASRGLQDARRELLGTEEFLVHYARAVDAEPQSSLRHYLRGRSRIEKTALAEADFRRAVALDPLNSWAVAGLAYLAYGRGDLFATVQIYEEAIAKSPRSAQLRLLLGNQFLELKLYIDAQRQLETAYKLAPEDLEVWAALGKVRLALGQEQEAFEIFRRTLAAEPRIAHIAPSMAAIYLRRGAPAEAERVYREGLQAGLGPDKELAKEIDGALVLLRRRARKRAGE